MTRASVAVDEVCPGTVTMLVVSDTVQVPDVIIGRAWLDLPKVAYHSPAGDCIYMKLNLVMVRPKLE